MAHLVILGDVVWLPFSCTTGSVNGEYCGIVGEDQPYQIPRAPFWEVVFKVRVETTSGFFKIWL